MIGCVLNTIIVTHEIADTPLIGDDLIPMKGRMMVAVRIRFEFDPMLVRRSQFAAADCRGRVIRMR